MSKQSSKQAWEEWQLTAFVLGELDTDAARRIETAATNDPQLASELQAIRQTLDQVSRVFEIESASDGLTAGSFDKIIAQAAAADPTPTLQVNKAKGAKENQGVRSRRHLWMGMLGLSASLLFALWLSMPTIRSWSIAAKPAEPLLPAVGHWESPYGDQVTNPQASIAATQREESGALESIAPVQSPPADELAEVTSSGRETRLRTRVLGDQPAVDSSGYDPSLVNIPQTTAQPMALGKSSPAQPSSTPTATNLAYGMGLDAAERGIAPAAAPDFENARPNAQAGQVGGDYDVDYGVAGGMMGAGGYGGPATAA